MGWAERQPKFHGLVRGAVNALLADRRRIGSVELLSMKYGIPRHHVIDIFAAADDGSIWDKFEKPVITGTTSVADVAEADDDTFDVTIKPSGRIDPAPRPVGEIKCDACGRRFISPAPNHVRLCGACALK